MSELVERLRQLARQLATGDDFHNDRLLTAEDTMYWKAAAEIDRLRAENELLIAQSLESQMLAHGWMRAHDGLLGWAQSDAEVMKKMLGSGRPNYNLPRVADMPDSIARAEAAEKRIRELEAEIATLDAEYDASMADNAVQKAELRARAEAADKRVAELEGERDTATRALRYFMEDTRFQVGVGGNPIAVERMLAEVRATLSKTEGKES